MKNVSIDDMITTTYNEAMLVCKDTINNGISGTKISIKAGVTKDPLIDDKFWYRTIGRLDQKEMETLAETNPKLFCEKFILSQFGDSFITDEIVGSNANLPNRVKRFYDNGVSFGSEYFQVHFADKSIEYFSEIINRLRLKRINDTLDYATYMINSGSVKNLRIVLSDENNINKLRINRCFFERGRKNPYHIQDTLYYNICIEENGNLNKCDLDNIEEIAKMFIEKNNGVAGRQRVNNECTIYTNNYHIGHNSEVTVVDYNKYYPDLVNRILCLKKG